MASTEQPVDPEVGKVEEEAPPPPPPESLEEAPPPPEVSKAPPCSPIDKCLLVDTILRFLLFAAAVAAVVVMVTSNQTKLVPLRGSVEAKFEQSPALIYFVAALSVAGLWALISLLTSISFLWKPICPKKCLLYFVFLDLVSLGIVASATGTAGAIGYLGLKGNDHVMWGKICSLYDKFCEYLAASIALSLFASIILVLLVSLSILSLHKKLP